MNVTYTLQQKRDLEQLVKETIVRCMTWKEALDYISAKIDGNIRISSSMYFEIKKKVRHDSKTWYLKMAQGQYEYLNMYRERLDDFNHIKREAWALFSHCRVHQDNVGAAKALQILDNVTCNITNLINLIPDIGISSKLGGDKAHPTRQQQRFEDSEGSPYTA